MTRIAFAPFVSFGSSAVRGPGATTHGLWLLLLLACDSPRETQRNAQRDANIDTARAELQVSWTVRPIVNAPRYFVLND